MAQLYRRPHSPFWWAKFQHDGVTHRFSTGKKKRSEASAELARQIAQARGEASITNMVEQLFDAMSKLPEKKLNEVRSSLVRRLTASYSVRIALNDVWDTWLNNPRSRQPSARTQEGYKAIWEGFKEWMSEHHKDRSYLDELSVALAESYAAKLGKDNVSARTYNAHLSFLRGLFHSLRNRAGLTENIWSELPRMESAPQGRRELTTEELVKVIRKAPNDLRTLFLIGAYTGMRLGDACLLKWKAINFQDGIIEYMPMKTARKGKVIRVPISQHLSQWLSVWKNKVPKGELVLPKIAKAYVKDRSLVTKRIQAHFKACKITTNEEVEDLKGIKRKRSVVKVGFHSLRHSFVSLCAANRVPQVAVMEMVGHGSPAMTRLYSHAGDEQKQKAIAALPELLPDKEG